MTLANTLSKAQRLESHQEFDKAARVYGGILARYPKNVKARKAMAALTQRLNQAAEPPAEAQQKIQAVFAAGNFQAAAAACAELLNSFRKSPFLWLVLGRCHLNLANLDQAATCLNKACELAPSSAPAFAAMGDVCKQQNQIPNAIALYNKALALNPDELTALNNLALVQMEGGRLHEAADLLERAARLAPDNARIVYNLANAVRETGRPEHARELYAKAAELAPDLAEAHFNLGQLSGANGDQAAAIENFDSVLAVNPGDDRARTQKLFMMAQVNDWRWVDEYQKHRRHLGLRGIACAPFALMALEDNPDLLRVRTQAHAASQFPPLPPAPPARAAMRPERLRIGYFSADFHDHATMHLIGGLFETHDQDRFEIRAYSYGAPVQDASRARAERSVCCFRDMSGLPDAGFAGTVQKDALDIAVDLKGYTGGTRSHLFGSRLAPLHMSYLGYPGTMGTTAYDYLIGDGVVCPPGSERYYDEHLIRLPHSYQANDGKREISGREFSRRSCGLPDSGFVFCCFNNSYKITPREFDIWMRLLAATEGSVLWLLASGARSEANLRQAAQDRGIGPDRLVFAPRIPQAEHLARQKAADLFLDTFTYNAHTTASDALWAGLPVLTMPGRQFAARVGASLLSALDMPGLIAANEAEYEARALELAHDPDRLAALRGQLRRNRLTAPLFDTRGFARDLERAFDMAFGRYLQGLPPGHISVPARPA